MRSIHLHDLHMSKASNLFASSIGGIACFALALFFFLVSWAVGGDSFKASIGGNTTLGVLVAGLIVSVISAAATKPEK